MTCIGRDYAAILFICVFFVLIIFRVFYFMICVIVLFYDVIVSFDNVLIVVFFCMKFFLVCSAIDRCLC